MARPKTQLDELPKDWQKTMCDMAANGASDVELRATALGCISDCLWYRLIKEEEEFSRTVKKCKQLCQAWWESKGRTELENNKFSYTGWYMNMKNRFGWKDKQEITQDVTIKPGSETLREAIESLEDTYTSTDEVLSE